MRDSVLAAVGIAHRQRHDAVRIVDGQTSTEHRVVDGEPRAREPDAEPEGDDRRRREPAFPEQQARREPQVLPRLVDPPGPAHVEAHLLDVVEGAELEARAPARLPLRQAGPDVVGDLTLDVVAQLAVQFSIEPVTVLKEVPPAPHCAPLTARAAIRVQLSHCRNSAPVSSRTTCGRRPGAGDERDAENQAADGGDDPRVREGGLEQAQIQHAARRDGHEHAGAQAGQHARQGRAEQSRHHPDSGRAEGLANRELAPSAVRGVAHHAEHAD